MKPLSGLRILACIAVVFPAYAAFSSEQSVKVGDYVVWQTVETVTVPAYDMHTLNVETNKAIMAIRAGKAFSSDVVELVDNGYGAPKVVPKSKAPVTKRAEVIHVSRDDGAAFAMSSNRANRVIKRYCKALSQSPTVRPTGVPSNSPKRARHDYVGTCK